MNDLKIQGKAVPLNFGPLRGADGNARLTGPCGDTMEFWIRVADDRLAVVTYITDGCGSSILAGYAAATLAEQTTLDQALALRQEAVLEYLGGLPAESRHCALLAVNTLHATIHDYLTNYRTKPV